MRACPALLLAAMLLLPLLLSACGGGATFERTVDGEEITIEDFSEDTKAEMRRQVLASLQHGQGTYDLRVGDKLEVLFHARPRPDAAAYRLQVGDTVGVLFPDDQALSQDLRIRPDGWISLPEAGDGVRAAGLTVAQLNAAINRRYDQVFRNSRTSVLLRDWVLDETRFIEDLETVNQGRARIVPVLRDGSLALPFLPPLPVQGLTLPQATEEIDKAYQALGLDIAVSLLMNDTVGDRIFVFGEVQSPGMMETDRPQTVLMSVAQAGGVTTSGSLGDVRVLYVDEKGEPRLRKVNLTNVLTELKLEEDITLPDNAVVYVPPTRLAATGRLLDQVLRQILFFQGFGASVTYEVF